MWSPPLPPCPPSHTPISPCFPSPCPPLHMFPLALINSDEVMETKKKKKESESESGLLPGTVELHGYRLWTFDLWGHVICDLLLLITIKPTYIQYRQPCILPSVRKMADFQTSDFRGFQMNGRQQGRQASWVFICVSCLMFYYHLIQFCCHTNIPNVCCCTQQHPVYLRYHVSSWQIFIHYFICI